MPTAEVLNQRGRSVLALYPRVQEKNRICQAAHRAGLKTSVFILQATMERVRKDESARHIKAVEPPEDRCGRCGKLVRSDAAARAKAQGRDPFCRVCQRRFGSKELKAGRRRRGRIRRELT